MLLFLARSALYFESSFAVSDRKTGIIPKGFTTENIVVNTPNKYVNNSSFKSTFHLKSNNGLGVILLHL